MSAFNKFRQVVENRHQYAREWKARTGGKVMGYFCTYFPEELVYAAGALPVRVLGSHQPQDLSERHIQSKWCPACRDCLAQGLLGRYDYLDGILEAHCCIHMKQAYVDWCLHLHPGFCYDLYVPADLDSPLARACLTRNIDELRSALQNVTGTALPPETLWNALDVYETNRRLLRSVYELRRDDNPPISGSEAMEVVLSTMLMDKKESSAWVEELLAELEARPRGGNGNHPRLMFIGSGNDDIPFLQMVESLGMDVVVDEHCIGARHFWGDTPRAADPITTIAERLIAKPPCPNKDLPRRRRRAFLQQMVSGFRVQGVIVIQQKFCDPHQWDAPELKSTMDEMGIPTLFLESDIVLPIGQFRVRLEAFRETLEVGAGF